MFYLANDGTVINLEKIIQLEKPKEDGSKAIIRTGFGSIFLEPGEYDKILTVMCQKKIIAL